MLCERDVRSLTARSVITRHQRVQVTYDELDRKSNALARGLQGIGVEKGDRVAVSLGNNMEFAIATYALFKLGAILNPLNPSFNTQQVVSALNHLETSHLIIGAETNLCAYHTSNTYLPLTDASTFE
jgi:acyl-CoA synthetase (AMP-forming)/AMP-acid ligase II